MVCAKGLGGCFDVGLVVMRRVKQYEVKLATINTINSALQSENDELRRQLEAAEAPKTDTGSL